MTKPRDAQQLHQNGESYTRSRKIVLAIGTICVVMATALGTVLAVFGRSDASWDMAVQFLSSIKDNQPYLYDDERHPQKRRLSTDTIATTAIGNTTGSTKDVTPKEKEQQQPKEQEQAVVDVSTTKANATKTISIDAMTSRQQETQQKQQQQQQQQQQQNQEVDIRDQVYKVFGIEPRPWKKWDTNISLPCFDGKVDTFEPKGFLFVKPKKCGSTTGSSITVRIASNLAKKKGYNMCQCWTDHIPAYTLGVRQRHPELSYLWSVVRNPTRRVVSEFFHFHVSRENVSASDASFMDFLKDRQTYENFFLRYLQAYQRRWNPIGDHVPIIAHILESYDFIAVTERMDESAVVLQLLLGLETTDVLYLSAKTSGGYDDGRWKDTCYKIQKSTISPGMKEYFDSPTFKASIYWDELLYDIINKSLDLTIDMLGRERFEQQLAKFRKVKSAIMDECASTVRLPCTAEGLKRNETDCLLWDIGCGFECMESVLVTVDDDGNKLPDDTIQKNLETLREINKNKPKIDKSLIVAGHSNNCHEEEGCLVRKKKRKRKVIFHLGGHTDTNEEDTEDSDEDADENEDDKDDEGESESGGKEEKDGEDSEEEGDDENGSEKDGGGDGDDADTDAEEESESGSSGSGEEGEGEGEDGEDDEQDKSDDIQAVE